jgi:glycosyltransferase involved in cell wall biosynthesis
MNVHQILPALSYRDAVSNDAITIQSILRKQGFKSEIYAKYIHPNVAKYAKNIREYRENHQNILFYHFSLAGDDITEFVKSTPAKKALIYHNITPPLFFQDFDINLMKHCRNGLNELKSLPQSFFMGIGDSEYNRLNLEAVGFNKTDVLPIFIDWNKFPRNCGKSKQKSGTSKEFIVLFVGRLSPNKKIEDIIKIFYYFNKSINSESKLVLCGDNQIPRYSMFLKNLVNSLKLQDSVIFTGSVTDEQIHNYYGLADIFLCMSEHEGFCVPLLEAMYYDLPIIAYNSTAIPYTLNNSGILVNKKDYQAIAELICIIIEDNQLKERILTKQRLRLQDFTIEKNLPKLLSIVETMTNHTLS